MAVAMEITVTEMQQVYNSQPSHHYYIPRLDHHRRAAAIEMINLNPQPADDEDDVNSTNLITPFIAQPEADFLSISIVDGQDNMQSMDEEQQSHTRSWREIRYVSFSSRTNSSSFRSLGGDGEEEVTRGGNNNNPTVTALRENEIGKMAITLAVSITTGLLGIKHSSSSSHPIIVCVIALALSMGYAATWNGILIRKINISSSSSWTSGGVSDLIEQLGTVLLLAAFFCHAGLILLSALPSH